MKIHIRKHLQQIPKLQASDRFLAQAIPQRR